MKGHSTGAMYIQLLMLHKRACTFYNKPLAFSGLALKDTFDWVWHLPEVYHWKNFLKDSGWRGFFPAILPFRIVLTLLVFSERCLVDDTVLCHWRRLALCVTSLGFSVFFFLFMRHDGINGFSWQPTLLIGCFSLRGGVLVWSISIVWFSVRRTRMSFEALTLPSWCGAIRALC